MLSRRKLLAALGASGASVALGGWLGACGGVQSTRGAKRQILQLDDLLPQLLDIIDTRLANAFVWTRSSQRVRVAKDSEEQHFDLEHSHDLVIGGDGHSLAIRNAASEEVLASAKQFVANLPLREAGPSPSPNSPASKQSSGDKEGGADPEVYSKFPKPLSQLYAASLRAGDSRIIYRNAFLLADQIDSRFLSRQLDLRHQESRQRAGVLFAAWTGDEVVSAVAERALSGSQDFVGPSRDELQSSAADALAHVHARSAPSGMQDVILSPACAGLVAMRAIASPGLRLGPRPVPSGPLRVHNDPLLANAYGSVEHDANGQRAKRVDFFGAESLVQMQEGNMRRDAALALRAMPANVVVEAGTASERDLIADVQEGVFLDAPLHCSVDPSAESLALLCGRGREIRDGRFTGRVFSRLLATAKCEPFFAQTRALGNTPRAQAFEEEGIAMSAIAPAWLSRASVEAG